MGTIVLIALMVAGLGLGAAVVLHPPETGRVAARVLLFVTLFLLPMLLTVGGAAEHLERSKRTEFCLSCHLMESYGESVRGEERSELAAVHYQDRLIDRDHACYTCHTTYAMYGDLAAKWSGVRHVWANTLGTFERPIELYRPYHNRECLYCHDGAVSFEESDFHVDIRAELGSNQTSCLDCHGPAHQIEGSGE